MSNLDDFFAKKDRKKPGKKADDAIKATDLFKVLDNAAQNVHLEDQEEFRKEKKELQLGPVLAEVLNAEEAAKWSEPVDEERQVDLSNLKIESLQSPEDDDEAIAAAIAVEQAAKPTKVWSVDKRTEVQIIEGLAATPLDRKEAEMAKMVMKDVGTEPRRKKETPKEIPKDPPAEPAQGFVQSVFSAVEHAVESLDHAAGSIASMILGTDKKDAEEKVETSATPVETPVAPPPSTGGYVPPHLRNKAPEVAKPAPVPIASSLTPSTGSASGAYKSPGQKMAEAEEAAKKLSMTASGGASLSSGSADSKLSSSSAPGVYKSIGQKKAEEEAYLAKFGGAAGQFINQNKKPELDNEEEFPTLGGPTPGGKHK